MEQFIAGFVVAVLVTVPLIVFFLRKKPSKVKVESTPENYSKQLEELGKLTGELAHEIKNPLSTIKVNLKLIAEDLEDHQAEPQSSSIPPRALKKIRVVKKETDRLEQILDAFLRYVDKTELQLADVDINILVSDMIDFYSPQCHRYSITIRQGLCPEPLACRVDVGMLKQAILNLFINAQQAMSDGGELIIRTQQQKEYASIEIGDTGIGIAPDKLPNIFIPYYSSRPQGSGLGLPTSKKIIEAHNGTLAVNSQPGKGTLFTLKLPMIVTSSKN